MARIVKRIACAVVLAIVWSVPLPASAAPDENTCAISRGRSCDIEQAVRRGLVETGLRPVFAKGVRCRKIDEKWAISYTAKRGRPALHGGIDIPAPTGTPILAVADGEVVALFIGENSFRGKEVVIRHSPKQTGFPFWTFSQYSHFDTMPNLRRGQRVKRGQVLGPTGNSGRGKQPFVQSRKRRPAIHFSVVYSKTKSFKISKNNVVVPKNAFWTDPIAFLSGGGSLDTYALRALPQVKKKRKIGVMLSGGKFVPASAKIIWPYACK